jgi:hypothetical protein
MTVGAPPGREYPQTHGWTFWRFGHAGGRLAAVNLLLPVARQTVSSAPCAAPGWVHGLYDHTAPLGVFGRG